MKKRLSSHRTPIPGLSVVNDRLLLADLRPSNLNASGLIVECRSTTLNGHRALQKPDVQRTKLMALNRRRTPMLKRWSDSY